MKTNLQSTNTNLAAGTSSVTRELNPNMPRETDNHVTPNWSVRSPCSQQWNESSRTALFRVFHSLLWYNSRRNLHDQDLRKSQANSKAGRSSYSVMVTLVWRWFTRLGDDIVLHLLSNNRTIKTTFLSPKRKMLEWELIRRQYRFKWLGRSSQWLFPAMSEYFWFPQVHYCTVDVCCDTRRKCSSVERRRRKHRMEEEIWSLR